MAEYLASIFGTEKDKVNCSFFFKIGACTHGERCSRIHNRCVNLEFFFDVFKYYLILGQPFPKPFSYKICTLTPKILPKLLMVPIWPM